MHNADPGRGVEQAAADLTQRVEGIFDGYTHAGWKKSGVSVGEPRSTYQGGTETTLSFSEYVPNPSIPGQNMQESRFITREQHPDGTFTYSYIDPRAGFMSPDSRGAGSIKWTPGGSVEHVSQTESAEKVTDVRSPLDVAAIDNLTAEIQSKFGRQEQRGLFDRVRTWMGSLATRRSA